MCSPYTCQMSFPFPPVVPPDQDIMMSFAFLAPCTCLTFFTFGPAWCRPQVSDFGLSQVLPDKDSAVRSTKHSGTVTHMPPELIEEGKVYQQVCVWGGGLRRARYLRGLIEEGKVYLQVRWSPPGGEGEQRRSRATYSRAVC